MIGIRVLSKEKTNQQKQPISQLPLFSFQKTPKSWITWINQIESNETQESQTLVFDQFQNVFFIYDSQGQFVKLQNLNEPMDNKIQLIDILSSTGLLIKYDPSIQTIYFGFGLLMITTFLSYFCYTQFWIYNKRRVCFLGCSTNRSKVQVEVEFENLIRFSENILRSGYF